DWPRQGIAVHHVVELQGASRTSGDMLLKASRLCFRHLAEKIVAESPDVRTGQAYRHDPFPRVLGIFPAYEVLCADADRSVRKIMFSVQEKRRLRQIGVETELVRLQDKRQRSSHLDR